MKGPDAEVTNPVVTRRHEESQKWLPTDLTDLSVCFLPPPHLAPGRHWMCNFMHVCLTKGLHSIKRAKCLKTSVTPVPRHCFPGVQRSLAEVEPVLFQVKAACAVKGLD